ncbi:uncharacterized protein LOC115964592 [Quercus lobata]|uniref:uncharacterized protein LOC115964592 n=1 Tax=Quercus lobata TaxID=97700 RepID=UPI001246DD57|nr:uncharacterized protein LOC115964592 [Quercus lobata]
MVFVVVDRFTKYVHFIPLAHLYIATKVAHIHATEVVNKSLEHYLRAFAVDRPHSSVDWLPLVEFWFNTNYHTSIKLTPFEALYGYPPPKVVDYVPGVTRVATINSYLQDRQQLFSLFKQNLNAAQERMKWFADKKRVDRSFKVGDWVYLKLQPYKQSLV